MSMIYRDYEAVIGLEVHAELSTASKIFCSCRTDFGAPPNTQCCPVCMGHPGTIPVLNRRAIELGARAGIALNCHVNPLSAFDRKNYFYPDLPKAYQITQFYQPLCEGGFLTVETEEGERRIGITRIHLEEDAGKLIHDPRTGTSIDYNRCGVPLLEIVSEPELHSPEEAVAYLKKLRHRLIYAEVSNGRMNEGAFRCDINLSVRKVGETALNTRTEMKNLNSFAFVAKAIEYEFHRQVDQILAGEEIVQETRRFDPETGRTERMRRKENSADYRYFPEPDIPPVLLTEEEVRALSASLPVMPADRRRRYRDELGLSAYDARRLTEDRALSDYFEAAAARTAYPKLLANLCLSELVSRSEGDSFECPIPAEDLAQLTELLGSGVINSSTARSLTAELWSNPTSPQRLVEERGLAQISDEQALRALLTEAMAQNRRSVEDYRRGKKAAAKPIIGAVMASTHGKANPVLLSALAEEMLNADPD